MDEFLKMDIFFFVATIAVIVLTLCVAYALWRLSRVLKQIEHISEQVAAETDNIRLDLADMRSEVRRGKGRLRSLFGLLSKTAKRVEKD